MKVPSLSSVTVGWFVLLAFTAIPSRAFATNEYVVADGNLLNTNTLIVYELNTGSGALTQIARLQTGGEGLGTVFPTYNLSVQQQAISPNATCIFALDARSQDIASFSKATNYALVGNYSDSALNPTLGGSLALTPEGKFLYATYISSGNIGAWVVNADCSLTLASSYFAPANVGSLKVTPNGNSLIVALASSISAEMYSINRTTGELTELGTLAGFCAPQDFCAPQGLDITKDNEFVIFAVPFEGNSIFPYAAVSRITPKGLAPPSFWSLNNSSRIADPTSVFLSASGYSGSGNLYFTMYFGVVATTFNENPPSIAVTNSTIIDAPMEDGNIAVTGQWAVIAEYPSQIGVYLINSDGSLTEASTTVLDDNPGIISLSIFPATR
jgi:Lactonase, 7-bladed beta-propeller